MRLWVAFALLGLMLLIVGLLGIWRSWVSYKQRRDEYLNRRVPVLYDREADGGL